MALIVYHLVWLTSLGYGLLLRQRVRIRVHDVIQDCPDRQRFPHLALRPVRLPQLLFLLSHILWCLRLYSAEAQLNLFLLLDLLLRSFDFLLLGLLVDLV